MVSFVLAAAISFGVEAPQKATQKASPAQKVTAAQKADAAQKGPRLRRERRWRLFSRRAACRGGRCG